MPHRGENKRNSTLRCTKTGGIQPKLNVACFVQSCLTDADFVIFSNYCLIGTRQKGCFFFALPRGSGCFPRRARRENAACAPQHQGGIFSFRRKRISPLTPPKRTRGENPSTPELAVSILKSCAACGIRCGVHGFAMNPYVSLPLSTAPYCREARVTFA